MTTEPETLLQRIARGDTGAVGACIDAYGGLVYALARRYLGGLGEDVDDAAQEIFGEVWRNSGRFDPGLGSEAAFIGTIARHRLIDRQRRESSRRRAQTGHADARAALAAGGDAGAVSGEVRAAAQAFGRLDMPEREVLWFAIFQGLTQEQIAEAMNLPLGTVKTRARRGLIRLREMLGAAQAGEVAR